MSYPTVGALFAGYGGLDLAVEEVFNAKLAWVSEYDKGPSKVLAHHWPNVPNLGDITQIDWRNVPPVDIITGGYPCQPFSLIGSRKGHAHAQHLWPHALDAIRHIRPHYAIFENVAGHLSLGFDTVLGDLTEIGYDVRWTTLRASTAGAPHKRERLFIVATNSSSKRHWEYSREPLAEKAGPEAGNEPADNARIWAAETWGPFAAAVTHWQRIVRRPAPNPIQPLPANSANRSGEPKAS